MDVIFVSDSDGEETQVVVLSSESDSEPAAKRQVPKTGKSRKGSSCYVGLELAELAEEEPIGIADFSQNLRKLAVTLAEYDDDDDEFFEEHEKSFKQEESSKTKYLPVKSLSFDRRTDFISSSGAFNVKQKDKPVVKSEVGDSASNVRREKRGHHQSQPIWLSSDEETDMSLVDQRCLSSFIRRFKEENRSKPRDISKAVVEQLEKGPQLILRRVSDPQHCQPLPKDETTERKESVLSCQNNANLSDGTVRSSLSHSSSDKSQGCNRNVAEKKLAVGQDILAKRIKDVFSRDCTSSKARKNCGANVENVSGIAPENDDVECSSSIEEMATSSTVLPFVGNSRNVAKKSTSGLFASILSLQNMTTSIDSIPQQSGSHSNEEIHQLIPPSTPKRIDGCQRHASPHASKDKGNHQYITSRSPKRIDGTCKRIDSRRCTSPHQSKNTDNSHHHGIPRSPKAIEGIRRHTTSHPPHEKDESQPNISRRAPKMIDNIRRQSSSSGHSSDGDRQLISKRRRSSEKDLSRLCPVKKRCLMNFLRRLKEEKDATREKPKEISRKGVQQLISDVKVVMHPLKNTHLLRTLNTQHSLWGEEEGTENSCSYSENSSPQHRHFLDVLHRSQENSTSQQVECSGAGPPLDHNTSPNSFSVLGSSVAKRLRLKRRFVYPEDEMEDQTSDVLPDLTSDSPKIFECGEIKVQEVKREIKSEIEETPGPSHPLNLCTVKIERPGREVRRDVYDRWWCCLPPLEHARLSVLDSSPLVMLPRTASNMIDGGLEEAGVDGSYSNLVIDLVMDYVSSKTEVPNHIIKYLLMDLVPICRPDRLSGTSSILQMFLDLYPPFMELCFTWENMENTLDWLCSFSRSDELGTAKYASQVCQFSIMVQSLETEFTQHSFASQRNILKSVVSRMLNADVHLQHLKHLVNALSIVLCRNELGTLDEYMVLNLGKSQKSSDNPKLINLIQRLLVLGLVSNRRQMEAAGLLVNEMYLVYKRLPNLSHRKVLFETITWPVLRLLLLQRVLEDQCDCSHVQISFLTLQTIFRFYVRECTPPFEAVTPPLTPSDDEESTERFTGQLYGESSCEELTFLLSQLVQTYIVFQKHGHYKTLHQRVLDGSCVDPMELDKGAVPQLMSELTALEKRLTTMCPCLSPRTKVYLIQIKCLLISVGD